MLAVKGTDRPIYLYAKQYLDFGNEADYGSRFGELLGAIRCGQSATLPERYRIPRVTYVTTPPRVANYLERPEALYALRNEIFAEDNRQPIALTALAGMGGIGKTVLAKALTEDRVVQRAFPDGIVWITAGSERQRDFTEEMREVGKSLGDDLSGYDTPLACEHAYRTTMINRAALIVVDDVWSKSDIEPLLVESPRSRFLFTTRDQSIGRHLGAREHRADLLDITQARKLLAMWANVRVERLPTIADEIIAECGRLPLALSVIGAILRESTAELWGDILDLLRRCDLTAIEDQLPKGQRSFFKSVEVSYGALKDTMRNRYKALAMLLEDMPAPLPVLRILWNTSESETRRTIQHFVDRSLAQTDAASWDLRLHDLQLDYVRSQYQDKETLRLVHDAIRLSSHVIQRDPSQSASQILSRLLSFGSSGPINELVRNIINVSGEHGFVPLKPGLTPPGGPLRRTLSGFGGLVCSISLSSDGKLALSGHDDCQGSYILRLWDLRNGKELATLTGDRGGSLTPMSVAVLSPDCTKALVATGETHYRWPSKKSGRPALVLWRLESGKPIFVLHGHSSMITDIAVDSGWRLAVTAGEDGTLQLWDLDAQINIGVVKHPSWRKLSQKPRIGRTVPHFTSLAFLPDDRSVLAASAKTVFVLDVITRSLTHLLETRGAIDAIAVSRVGKTLIIARSKSSRTSPLTSRPRSTLEVWDYDARQLRCTLGDRIGSITSVDISADGRVAISSSDDHLVRVWDLVQGCERRVFRDNPGPVDVVKLAKDGTLALSGGPQTLLRGYDGNSMRVWDLTLPDIIRTDHAGAVRSTVTIPDSKLGVSGGDDGIVRFWSLAEGREIANRKVHSAAIQELIVSQNGKLLVSAAANGTINVLDVESMSDRIALKGCRVRLNNMDLSSGRRLLISGVLPVQRRDSQEQARGVMLWDLESSAKKLITPQGDAGTVAISPDGQFGAWSVERILKDNGRGTRFISTEVEVWNLSTGAIEMRVEAYRDSVPLFLPDGLRLITHDFRCVEVWRVGTWSREHVISCEFSGPWSKQQTFKATADSRYLVAAGGRVIAVLDLLLQSEIWRCDAGGDVHCLAVFPNGQTFVSASSDGSIILWDLRSGCRRAEFFADYPVFSAQVSSDGEFLIAGDSGGNVHILRTPKLE